jgi:hypothetical protein
MQAVELFAEAIRPFLDVIGKVIKLAEEIKFKSTTRPNPLVKKTFPLISHSRFSRRPGCHSSASSRFSARAPCAV